MTKRSHYTEQRVLSQEHWTAIVVIRAPALTTGTLAALPPPRAVTGGACSAFTLGTDLEFSAGSRKGVGSKIDNSEQAGGLNP